MWKGGKGSYPTYAYPAGLDENIRKKLEQMTDEELEKYYDDSTFSEGEEVMREAKFKKGWFTGYSKMGDVPVTITCDDGV